MDDFDFAPEALHLALMNRTKPTYAYTRGPNWREGAQHELTKLLFPSNPVPVNLQAEATEVSKGFSVTFYAEEQAKVIGELRLPEKKRSAKAPLLICVQGHNVDMTMTWGECLSHRAPTWKDDGLDYGAQALERGYAVFTIEQRAFGLRRDQRPKEKARYGGNCHNGAMVSLLYGRTLVGSRVLDIRKSIEAMRFVVNDRDLPIDLAHIACVGHSGGGTATLYAAALDESIKACIVAGALCSYDASIASIDHCVCNYVPSIRRYFEIGDVASLIAPRPLVVSHGVKDQIFPIDSVRQQMQTVSKAYADRNAADSCILVEQDAGHVFGDERVWEAFEQVTGW